MPDAQQEIQITFRGNTESIDAALKRMSSGFGAVNKSADGAAVGTHKVATGAAEVEREAKGMTRGVEVAADAFALLSKESAEATRRLYEVRSLASDMRGAFSNMGAAIAGGMAAFAGVAIVGFLASSVKEAMASEVAWSKLSAAYKGNASGLRDVKRQIEETAGAWAKYKTTTADLAGMVARAAGSGISAKTILGNPKDLADIAQIMGTTIPEALAAFGTKKGASSIVKRLGFNAFITQEDISIMSSMGADARLHFVEGLVRQSKFSGGADAAANTAAGKFAALNTSMKNLKDAVGNSGLIDGLSAIADGLTNILGVVTKVSAHFGGLAQVLKVLWIPLVLGALVLFTGLRGVFTSMISLFGRLMGGFTQTATGIADAKVEAGNLADAIHAIPEIWTTTAEFIPATLVKDAYIANIHSIPLTWSTKAEFIPAAIPAMAGVTEGGITVPVMAGVADVAGVAADETAMQATVKPIVIPVQAGVPGAVGSVTTTGLIIPIKAGAADDAGVLADAIAMEETAKANAVKIPVQAIPLSTVSIAENIKTLDSYGAKHAVKIPVVATGSAIGAVETQINTLDAYGTKHTIKVPMVATGLGAAEGQINTLTSFGDAKIIKIPMVTTAAVMPVRAVTEAIAVADAYASKHPVDVKVVTTGGVHVGLAGGQMPIEPILAPNAAAQEQLIRTEIQTGVNKGGPIPVQVRPQWSQNALSGLKQGLAGGVAFGVVDALFNGLVTIKQANMPNVKMPSPPVPATLPGGRTPQLLPVHGGAVDVRVINGGSLLPALTNPHGNQPPAPPQRTQDVRIVGAPTRVQVVGNPYVGLIAGQSVHTIATGRGGTIDVNAHQAGGWNITLNPDAFARMGQMILEITIGSALGSMLGNLGLGPIKNLLSKWGKKGKGGPGDTSGGADGLGTAVSDVEHLLGVATVGKGGAPATFFVTGAQAAANTFVGKFVEVVGLSLGGGAVAARLGMALFKWVGGAIEGMGPALASRLNGVFGIPSQVMTDANNFAKKQAEAGQAAWLKANPHGNLADSPVGQYDKMLADRAKTNAAINKTMNDIGSHIISGIGDGIKNAKAAWASIGSWIMNTLGGLFKSDGSGGHGTPPHKGDVWVNGTKLKGGSLPGHWAGPGTGLPLPPHSNLLQQNALRQIYPAGPLTMHPTGSDKQAPAHHTINVHAGAIVINGNQHPQDVAREVVTQLTQMVSGVQAARRLH